MMLAKRFASWQAQIRILWWGYTLLMAVAAMSLPYWPLYLTQLLPNSPVAVKYWSGLIYLAPFISGAIFAPIWGIVGDKYGYKAMLIRACVGLAATQLLIYFTSNVILIFMIRFLQGALAGVIVAAQSWALAISPATAHGGIIGKLQSALAIGELLGPALGGVIAFQCGYSLVFLLSSLICLIVTIVFYFALHNAALNNDGAPTASRKNNNSRGKGKYINWNQVIALILLVIIFSQIARSIFTPFFALYVLQQIGGSSVDVGILSSATALAISVSAPLWGRYFDRVVRLQAVAYVVMALLLIVTASLQLFHLLVSSFYSLLLLRLLWGVAMGGLLPMLLKTLLNSQGSTPKGVILGIGNSSSKLGNLIGAIAGAVILTQFGFSESFQIMAGLYLTAGLVMLILFLGERQRALI